MTIAPTLRSVPTYRPAPPAAEPSTLIVNVQIAVPRDTPAADRVFALADRLYAIAAGEEAAARVSTTVAVVLDETPVGTGIVGPESPRPAVVPELALLADRRIALLDGQPLHLTRLEYDLLLFLARHPGQVFSRGQLLAQVWGHTHTTARTVDVHISRLRTKLGDQDLITTVYGLGYRLADDAAVTVAA
jgi:DNA-binding response OmpR family regulator